MESFQRSLRFAARSLSRSPGFSAVAVLTLALGIGATTAIFSVVNGVLLKPLPYPDADRIVYFWQINDEGNESNVSEPNFLDVKERSRSFAELAETSGAGPVAVVGGREPVRAPAAAVSEEFFDVMRVRPELGRLFVPDEQRQGAAPAVLVSHDFWQGALGGTPDVLGRTLTFQDRVHTVVGVMPPGFDFPQGADLWTPRELAEPQIYRTAHNWTVVGRLRDGVSVEQARAEVSAIARRLKQEYGDDTWMEDATVVPLHEQLVGRVRPALLVLLGGRGLPAADRVCQRRQLAAGPRHLATEGAGDPAGARGGAAAGDPALPGRVAGADTDRRGARGAPGGLGSAAPPRL